MNLLYFWTGGGIAWAGGSTATIGVSAQSGRFAGLWTGSTALVGVEGISGQMITRQKWAGSLAVIGANAFSGRFDGVASSHGRASTMIVTHTRTKTRLHQSRTAMMVASGQTRSER